MRTSYFKELEKELEEKICSGAFPEGKPIPTETEMMSIYKMGRTTVRKALQRLVDAGMLHKVQGLGTFVIPKQEWHQEKMPLKIQLIVPGFNGSIMDEDLFDRALITGIGDYTFSRHASLEIHRQEPSAKKLFARYRNLKTSGIIWERPWEKYYPVIEELRDMGVPQVTINREIDGVASVFFGYKKVLESVINVFRAIGRKKIIFCDVRSQTQVNVFTERQKYFMELMRKTGVDDDNVVYTVEQSKFTPDIVDKIFAEHPDIEGMICTVNYMPLLLPWLRKLPWIPLVSFGENDELNRDTDDTMNFIIDARENVGRKAAELIDDLSCKRTEPMRRWVRGEFLVRKISM